MAAIWQAAPASFMDPNGRPYSGAKAYFFDAGTTTPRTVYKDSVLGVSHDHPVVAGANGMFPPVFLPQGDYRLRVTTASGATLYDADGITTPVTSSSGGGGGGGGVGFQTGDIVLAYSSSVRSGYVRANGRTIGNGASGASERANADTLALYRYLWSNANLAVIGGRGSTADGDFAANKQLALPDAKARALACVDDFGGGATNRVPATLTDGGASFSIPGTTAGTASVVLTIAQMANHAHGGGTVGAGDHAHEYQKGNSIPVRTLDPNSFAESAVTSTTTATSTVGAHAHAIPAEGGNEAHTNMQPTMALGVYIKL